MSRNRVCARDGKQVMTSFEIDPGLRKRVRILAAHKEGSYVAELRRAVEEYVEREERRLGLK